ncbi:MAG TPA: tetratricopeptide repeat protein [Anaerolineales bacterium]|nr:tetratricopeptide repeat protein [Anaerolineales bacterium]
MNRGLIRRAWPGILIGLALLSLPNAIWRSLAPFRGELPTPTARPSPDVRQVRYEQGLALAASDPLAALPLLEELMFSDYPDAESARILAQAIQAARLIDDPAYLFTSSGQALAAIGEWRLARKAFLQAVQQEPDYAEAWAYLGEAQYHNKEDSLPALERALELNPNSMSVQLFSALYWQRHNDFEQANLHFYVATTLDPENPEIYIQWGKSAMLAAEPVEARELFERAVELTPDDLQVWKALAEYSIESELYVEELGMPAASKLVTADATDAEAMVLLGRAYALLGREETSRVFLERAVELDPTYPHGHFYLAIFLLAEGETDEALAHLNQVIALAPGSPEAEQASELIIQYSN